ncbi:type VII secretion protein EssC [Rummeliibacillus suwonensis]|uniref:type VII secretion protein EssC n=1 Tax=Rummeliibacillus suwonensis TaxID=1306154 RepID=UPI001AAE352D|nr:type VII secretion protein EssC [Rummeliibacillus suwonensis]MBO2535946.1 type VII secretion protein EssC [Rummeliibacillus suwonensis]
MRTLWIYANDFVYYYPIEKEKELTIGKEKNQTITLNTLSDHTKLTVKMTAPDISIYLKEQLLCNLSHMQSFSKQIDGHSIRFLYTNEEPKTERYYVGKQTAFSVSGNDVIQIDKELSHSEGLRFVKYNDSWSVYPSSTDVYINGKKQLSPSPLNTGDQIMDECHTFSFIQNDIFEVTAYRPIESALPTITVPTSKIAENYPFYRRTPRMIYELPKEKVSLSFPSQKNEDHHRGLLLVVLPPLIMLIALAIMAFIQPRGIYIVVTLLMFIVSIVTSSVQFVKDKKQQLKREKKRIDVYQKYLEAKRAHLHELASEQRTVMEYHFPSFEQMKGLTSSLSDRIWERSLKSHDFLQFRLGTGTVESSFQIDFNANDLANRELDDLIEQSQQLENTYSHLQDLPMIADLAKGPLGIVGQEPIVKRELHQMIGQLAFFNSYHDLRIVLIFHQENYQEWEWMKWLPHFTLPHMQAKGFIYDDQTKDQLLNSLYELIRERELNDEENVLYRPHMLFVVLNQDLLVDHKIMEYLEKNLHDIGISTVFAAKSKEELHEEIATLVRYVNPFEGDILIENKRAIKRSFKMDKHYRVSNEKFARELKALNHQIGFTNSIPESISFLEMLDVHDMSQLPIATNWREHEAKSSLAVPIGVKGVNEVVELNLHERAHGPHGLLAGTTGSGKSEFLQTYILSLAVHFHPYEVAFLLIDYKGGGMAQPFRSLPHLLGTITNLDGSKNFSARALASIKSELKRRQQLFDTFNVNHINDYNDLVKNHIAAIPMPHLFLICDEFAELKTEEPEFIGELVSAARIGRSLGVHLILATQKPGGIIDDQIWSNTNFRIALKVQNASDSKDILKNSDAAAISVTGRGYLQVGNNEVYELFQSAWSGAPYLEDTSDAESEVAIIADLGLIPLSNVESKKTSKRQEQTEIDMIVHEIEQVQKELKIDKLPSPWLPPLKELIHQDDAVCDDPMKIPIAMVDEPELQKQSPYYYEMIKDGNIAIFGSAGYGKSTTALLILLSMARNFSPEEIHYYILDFGNGALLPLASLAHTADVFTVDDHRKIEKFLKRIRLEMASRKKVLQKKQVNTIQMYNQIAEKQLPLLFITIENFDFIKEELPDIEMILNQYVRDGQSLGIYFIFTATRINAIRSGMMNNLKTKIVHYLLDHTEAASVLGRLPYLPEPIPGRSIIKKESAYFSQVFIHAEGKDDFERFENVKQVIQIYNEKYKYAMKPEPIPMLPDRLTTVDMQKYISSENPKLQIPIGLEEENVTPVCLNLHQVNHCLIVGPSQSGKTNICKFIVEALLKEDIQYFGIFEAFQKNFTHMAHLDYLSYLSTKEEIAEWIETVEEILTYRAENEDNLQEHPPIVLLIDGYSFFQNIVDSRLQERLSKLIKNYTNIGFTLIVTGSNNDFSKGYDAFTNELKQLRQGILLMKKSDQTIFNLPFDRKEREIHNGFGYYVKNGQASFIQIPLVVESGVTI